ncbi:MAG: hypothetical protein ABH856_03950 [Patescibacteria group bacterium]|nr:hypothetical protein [Patescibacteria group bacterium]
MNTPDTKPYQHAKNSLEACNRLGLDPETYSRTFEEISQAWDTAGGYHVYLNFILLYSFPDKKDGETPSGEGGKQNALVQLCKTPQDFIDLSDILLPRFEAVYKLQSGSLQFVQALLRGVKIGLIKTLGDFQETADCFLKQLDDRIGLDGKQFEAYLQEVRERVEQSTRGDQ